MIHTAYPHLWYTVDINRFVDNRIHPFAEGNCPGCHQRSTESTVRRIRTDANQILRERIGVSRGSNFVQHFVPVPRFARPRHQIVPGPGTELRRVVDAILQNAILLVELGAVVPGQQFQGSRQVALGPIGVVIHGAVIIQVVRSDTERKEPALIFVAGGGGGGDTRNGFPIVTVPTVMSHRLSSIARQHGVEKKTRNGWTIEGREKVGEPLNKFRITSR